MGTATLCPLMPINLEGPLQGCWHVSLGPVIHRQPAQMARGATHSPHHCVGITWAPNDSLQASVPLSPCISKIARLG